MNELLLFVARAGGGGSSGGGGGAGVIFLPVILVCAILSWHRRRQRIKKAKVALHTARSQDESWSDEALDQRAGQVFHAFQEDWSTFDTENMKAYLTTRYHTHMTLVLAALWQMRRRNVMTDVELRKLTLFDVHDNPDDELDRFTMEVQASATDVLVDEVSGKELKASSASFTELWHFEREGNDWMLDSISQINNDGFLTEYNLPISSRYADFATHNNFFYNADFGWLLMPLHGMLFSSASYGRSDINHHVIGLYHNIVVQFFEYIPIINQKATLRDHLHHFYKPNKPLARYTIAHTTLPKSYTDIVVERRRPLSFFGYSFSGMTKITLEWSDFNKLFTVYAADADKVASLELLNPAFMQQLASLPFRVSLEVIGTDLYLYSTDKSADYQQMLELLKKAFKEMKM